MLKSTLKNLQWSRISKAINSFLVNDNWIDPNSPPTRDEKELAIKLSQELTKCDINLQNLISVFEIIDNALPGTNTLEVLQTYIGDLEEAQPRLELKTKLIEILFKYFTSNNPHTLKLLLGELFHALKTY